MTDKDMEDHHTIYLDGKSLTIEDVINIAEKGYKVAFPQEIKNRIIEMREKLDKQLVEHPEIKIYATNVLYGDLKDKEVPLDMIKSFQLKCVMSHNCGTGDPLPLHIVRAIMAIRLNSFGRNLSAMRWETCQLLIDMLNKGVTPWVLEEGSVGASGDLVPLAMISAVMVGIPEAKAYFNGELLPAQEALKKAGLQPTQLGAKEGVGIMNGSNFIASMAVFAVRDAQSLIKNASIAAALSLEAIRGEQDAFSHLINDNRPHPGQLAIAQQMRDLLNGSCRSSKESQVVKFPGQSDESAKERIQDRYSYRSVPQVHGPVLEAVQKLRDVVSIEINSATDNPLFFIDENGFLRAKSGANFHGQPMANVIDYVKIALTGLALISDKRSFSMLDHRLSYGLPNDLAFDTAKADGGLMITQYAGAARAAECRVLSTPASVMSLSTAANQEDFVSMGSIGVLHLRKIIHNVAVVIGVELLCALRGIQLTKDWLPKNLQKLGKGTSKVFEKLEKELGEAGHDRYLRTEMEKTINLVKSGELVQIVEDCFK